MKTITDIGADREAGAAISPQVVIADAPVQGVVNWRLPVPGEGLLIGRQPGGSGIAIADPKISSQHLRLLRDPSADPARGWLRIEDVGSKNGTFVNGRRVKRATVVLGDVIRVGSSCLVVSRTTSAGAVEDPDLGLLGDAPALREACERAARGASSDLPILVLGETGTGKEVIARLVHARSGRAGPMLACNCAAIADTLIDATLFGHEKGAFTGASQARRGFFREASGGTLLLDEIGEMPEALQPRLLRAIEQREIVPVGASRPLTVDARVVAATNRDLEARVAEGAFRGDLYARLSPWTIRLPALRQRREDILRLARWFMGRAPASISFQDAPWEPDVAEALLLYDWPFNVRELKQVVEALQVEAGGGTIAFGLLPKRLRSAFDDARRGGLSTPVAQTRDTGSTVVDEHFETRPQPLRRFKTPAEAELREVLHAHDFNIAAVARYFERDRKQVYRWMKRYDIEEPS